jgi:hypothetical protein
MANLTPEEQAQLDELVAEENQLRQQKLQLVSRAGEEDFSAGVLQAQREMRGGGGPISPEAERSAAKMSMRVGIPLVTGVATGGLGPLAQAAYGAGSSMIGEFGAETIDKITGGKDYSGRQILGAGARGSAPFIQRLPGANRLLNVAKNVGLATGAGLAGGAIEGTVTNAPTALREALISAGFSGVPQLAGQVPGVVGEEIQKVVGRAETIQKGGITPLLTDVLPGLAAFAQRAQSKISSGTLRELEENQLRQIEQEARRLGGVEGVGTPGDVRRVYQDAVTLLGLNKVREISGNAGDFSSAANALKQATAEAQAYGSQLMSLEQKAYGEANAIQMADSEKAYNDFVQSLGTRTEKEAAAELAPRISVAERRATESAFPAGVPRAADTAQKGFKIQELITQPAEGQPPGLKQLTDDFFRKEYAGVPTQDEVFELGDLSQKVRELSNKLPDLKIPVLGEIIGRLNKVSKVPAGTAGNIYTGFQTQYRDVPGKFSLDELRGIRRDLENWAYSNEAYRTPAQAQAKDLANSITALMNEQAPQVFKPEIAQQLLDTNKKYAQVRQLWENPLVESAFAGVKATPEKMLERIGSSVVKYGTSASDYRGITDLMDNLKAIGVEGVPDRSEINGLVQQYIATQALDKTGKIDNTKLLGILNGIERTSTGSIKKLGFGDIAQLENFDVIKQLVDQNTKNGQVDYRGLLTKLSVIGSEDPSKLKALGLGSIDDVDRLNRIVGDMGEQASMAAKARELAKSDTMAGYQVSERILGLLDDSKDIRSVMNVLQDQVVSGATPELRKQAANALVNTRASAIEDLLFGRTQGVSQGAASFNLDEIKKRLGVPSQREELTDILGQNLMSRIEKDLLPAMALIEQRRNLAGQAGATTRGALIERGASAAVQAPFATGMLLGTSVLAGGQAAPSAALAAIAGTALTIGGTALASKVLARTVGATGLKSKAAAAASIEALIDRVNRAPNREAAIDIMNAYADTGTVPEKPSE